VTRQRWKRRPLPSFDNGRLLAAVVCAFCIGGFVGGVVVGWR
jgi:hypothetical protein